MQLILGHVVHFVHISLNEGEYDNIIGVVYILGSVEKNCYQIYYCGI